jgi:hypothetical protein
MLDAFLLNAFTLDAPFAVPVRMVRARSGGRPQA